MGGKSSGRKRRWQPVLTLLTIAVAAAGLVKFTHFVLGVVVVGAIGVADLLRRRGRGLGVPLTFALAFVALFMVMLSANRAVGSPPPNASAAKADCAFSNPGYSGWCRQTVPIPSGATPKQACEAVLSCLNGNACEANYCNAGNLRSGWRLEEAKASPPPR